MNTATNDALAFIALDPDAWDDYTATNDALAFIALDPDAWDDYAHQIGVIRLSKARNRLGELVQTGTLAMSYLSVRYGPAATYTTHDKSLVYAKQVTEEVRAALK